MSAPRPAAPSDVPELLRLIVELAVYEEEPDAVKTTEADLERALFGEAPAVFAFVVDGDEPGELAGLAIWFLTFSTWEGVHGIHLEDLYVAPQHRGAGHGRALLARLAQEAVARGLARVEWAVLDWNEPSIGFYRSLGASSMDEWTTFRLDGDALSSLGAS
ncbi:GNAT family N-acetyltransferase [Frigoribacterium sp. CFBP 13729]|uniref:GNAT family N-acetyltransferase n=1 Tax=unclassified Frigoribacterium TaxID=2627005 RepID=UPI0017833DF4|nr:MULTISPECIES: GNAT family N-acetyltransferase [unclassified Frigoribacterium]MBD8583311.1 GNAT family N-acetyltransferase [Frigoribacterium sp. CFBP 8766]MBD8610909.1 GNAT family N-acetyltransferase [Frigoribacterium sp. CFBP 13729]